MRPLGASLYLEMQMETFIYFFGYVLLMNGVIPAFMGYGIKVRAKNLMALEKRLNARKVALEADAYLEAKERLNQAQMHNSEALLQSKKGLKFLRIFGFAFVPFLILFTSIIWMYYEFSVLTGKVKRLEKLADLIG